MEDYDSQDLFCQKCNLNYDKGDHNPRMLPKCGHSMCQMCIVKFLESVDEKFFCLECQIEYSTQLEISQFPKNYALMRVLDKFQKIQYKYSEPKEMETDMTSKGDRI